MKKTSTSKTTTRTKSSHKTTFPFSNATILWALALILVVIVLGILFTLLLSNATKTTFQDDDDPKIANNANPTRTIRLFGDFTKQESRDYFITLLNHVNTTDTATFFIYKNTADPDSPTSIELAGGAECANQQGLFWAMAQSIYNQNQLFAAQIMQSERFQLEGNFISVALNQFASKIPNLNAEAFAACLNDKSYLTRINEDNAEAADIGITNLPALYLDDNSIQNIDQIITE